MSMKQKGKAVLNPGTVDEVWGLCDDIEIGNEADKEQVKNGDGDTVGLIYTDKRRKVSGNYTPLAEGATGGPVTKDDLIGEELELKLPGEKTIKIIVDEASLKHTRGTIPTFSISGYYYPNLTASASEASTGGGSGA